MARASLTAVILLAGGRGRRLGGANKALLGRGPSGQGGETTTADPPTTTLLGQWCAALEERGLGGALVGDPTLGEHLSPAAAARLTVTQESPAFSGPAAGVCAGVRALLQRRRADADAAGAAPEQLLLCAVDVAEPAPLLDWLLRSASRAPLEPGRDGLLPFDGQGRPQWLASVIAAEWLRRRVGALPPDAELGQSLRWLLGDASLMPLAMPPHLGHDIDDPEQARRFGFQL